MQAQRKDKMKAMLGTILFHALLILALFFMALKTPLPLPDEEGVEVNMGYSAVGQTVRQAPQKQPDPTPPAEKIPSTPQKVVEQPKEAPVEKVVEQNTEEAPAIAAKEKPKEQPKKEEKVIEQPKEEKKPEPEKPKEEPKKEEPKPEPKPVVDQRLIYTGPKASSQGNDQKEGVKGVETGTPNSTNYSGPGGVGENGISYNLGNRKANTLPKPSYNSDDQGRVNVSIWVDKTGHVIRAEILQKGTTVSDIRLRNMARNAALKAVFAPDKEAPEVQKGTITYNFIKLN